MNLPIVDAPDKLPIEEALELISNLQMGMQGSDGFDEQNAIDDLCYHLSGKYATAEQLKDQIDGDKDWR